jgi:hypothetical protein
MQLQIIRNKKGFSQQLSSDEALDCRSDCVKPVERTSIVASVRQRLRNGMKAAAPRSAPAPVMFHSN